MSTVWTQEYEDLLRKALPLLPARQALDPDAALVELGLDSLGSVKLLLELEVAFELCFPDEMINPSMFSTAGQLWQAVCELRSNADTGLSG